MAACAVGHVCAVGKKVWRMMQKLPFNCSQTKHSSGTADNKNSYSLQCNLELIFLLCEMLSKGLGVPFVKPL